MRRLVLLATLAAAVVVPAVAEAKTKRVFWQVDAVVAVRAFDHIGFTPITGIQEEGEVTRYEAGTTTFVVTWFNALASGPVTLSLKNLSRTPGKGMYIDRPLRKKEKRRGWRVALDLARDADVLVVHPDNPVCQSGLTRAQAHDVASGEITSWSQVGGSGTITRRLIGSEDEIAAFAHPRFGVKTRQPKAVVERDGGVSQIAGNPSVAAVTAWSYVRNRSGVCAVPIDGVRPSNASVHGLQYGPAYKIQFLLNKRRPKFKAARVMYREYLRFLRSEKASADFRARGLLLADEPVPADGAGTGGGGGGEVGPPVRDDAGVRADLEGERFQMGSTVLAFDPGGAYTTVQNPGDPGTCTATPGAWTLVEGYRYSHDGGGTIATVDLDGTTMSIRMPDADPGSAEVGGEQAVRDPSLPNGCP